MIHVVHGRELVNLTMRLEGKRRSVNGLPFLSSLPDAFTKRRLNYKVDLTLPSSQMTSPGFENLYSQLRVAEKHVIVYMVDAWLSRGKRISDGHIANFAMTVPLCDGE